MIKGLTSSSPYIVANYPTTPYIGNQGSLAGQMRYNTFSNATEVYDGLTWHTMSSHASISLSYEAEEAIKWANKKRLEEMELQAKMEKYPTLKHAYEQFKIVEALVHENE